MVQPAAVVLNTTTEQMPASQTSISMSQQMVQHNLAMSYINKEPFNEDLEPEDASSSNSTTKWLQMFKELIDEIKKLHANPNENVG